METEHFYNTHFFIVLSNFIDIVPNIYIYMFDQNECHILLSECIL